MDVVDFNRRWLQAWTDKSVDDVMSFYHPRILYFDENLPAGISGADALRAYLPRVFSQTPNCAYRPDQVWRIKGGFCGRWLMDLVVDTGVVKIRGLDLVLLEDGKIIHNEVYTQKQVAAT